MSTGKTRVYVAGYDRTDAAQEAARHLRSAYSYTVEITTQTLAEIDVPRGIYAFDIEYRDVNGEEV